MARTIREMALWLLDMTPTLSRAQERRDMGTGVSLTCSWRALDAQYGVVHQSGDADGRVRGFSPADTRTSLLEIGGRSRRLIATGDFQTICFGSPRLLRGSGPEKRTRQESEHQHGETDRRKIHQVCLRQSEVDPTGFVIKVDDLKLGIWLVRKHDLRSHSKLVSSSDEKE